MDDLIKYALEGQKQKKNPQEGGKKGGKNNKKNKKQEKEIETESGNEKDQPREVEEVEEHEGSVNSDETEVRPFIQIYLSLHLPLHQTFVFFLKEWRLCLLFVLSMVQL